MADITSLRLTDTQIKKRGASPLPGPRFEGSRIALVVKPSNAESPTPMYNHTP